MKSPTRAPILTGMIHQVGALYRAECARCAWMLRRKDLDIAKAQLKAHHLIVHPRRSSPAYLED